MRLPRLPVSNRRCLDFRWKREEPDLFRQYDRNHVRSFGSAREGLLALGRALSPSGTGSVLLPALTPEGLFAPFDRLGWRVTLYRVDRELEPDWEDLRALLIRHRPQLAVLIHYFGLPRPISRFTDMCREFGALSIEDMAHSYLGEAKDGSLGTGGDYALYSLPKMVGVPDGGILVARSPEARLPAAPASRTATHRLYVWQMLVLLALSSLGNRVPGAIRERGFLALARVLAGDPYRSLMRAFVRPAPMSSISKRLLRHVDHQRVVSRRRALARLYSEGPDRERFRPFRGADEPGNVMMGYPVTVDGRDQLSLFLRRRGMNGVLFVDRWDFIPETERRRHADALWVMQNHYLMPLYHRLKDQQVLQLIDFANTFEPRAGTR